MLANFCMFACALLGATAMLGVVGWAAREILIAYLDRRPDYMYMLYIASVLIHVRRNNLEQARYCLAKAEAEAKAKEDAAHADSIDAGERQGKGGGE